jgi:hypothetical protein
MAQSSYWPKLVLGILAGFVATQAWLSWSVWSGEAIALLHSPSSRVGFPLFHKIDWSQPDALESAGWPTELDWTANDQIRQVERPDDVLPALLGENHSVVQPVKPESVVWVDRHRFVAEWRASQAYAGEWFYLLFEVDPKLATGPLRLRAFASRMVLDDLSIRWRKQAPDKLVWSRADSEVNLAFTFTSWDVDNDPYTFQRAFAAELDLDSLLRARPDSAAAQYLQVVDHLVETR